MSHDTFVTDDFEEDAQEIVDEIDDAITHDHYEGEVEYETYRQTDEPVDIEVTIRGEWADLVPVTATVQQSDRFSACVFAQSDDGRGRVILGLEYYPDVEGIFQKRSY
jgi:hypothetical protein